MLAKLVMGIGLAIPNIALAQQSSKTEVPPRSEGEITAFSFAGLAWRMPSRFFHGITPFSNNSQELRIQFGWEKSTDTFAPDDVYPDDMKLSAYARTVETEDPRNALAMMRQLKRPLDTVPLFAKAKFDQMTYLGSSSIGHYFALGHEDAYVSCWLIKADDQVPPKVPPDILSRRFTCDTTFRFPNGIYVWLKSWDVDLNDVGPAFIAVHREILSFVH